MHDRIPTLRDVLPSAAVALSPVATLRQALGTLRANRVAAAPVIASGGGVAGVVSAASIEAWLSRVGAEIGDGCDSDLDRHTVEAVMTRRLLVLPPPTDLDTALRTMRQLGVEHVVVMDGQVCLGLVSAADLVRLTHAHDVRVVRALVGERGRLP